MPLKLLGSIWRVATPSTATRQRRRAGDWAVEPREPSQWNPRVGARADAPLPTTEQRPVETVWPETQPWCHD